MWRDNKVLALVFQQWIALDRRFIWQYVDRGGRNGAGPESLHQRCAVNQPATRRINQYCGGLRERETNWKPENRNFVAVPLSCGRWPRKPGDAKYEFVFEETDQLKNMNAAIGD